MDAVGHASIYARATLCAFGGVVLGTGCWIAGASKQCDQLCVCMCVCRGGGGG